MASAIIGARVDYCNSLLYGTTERNLNRLQKFWRRLTVEVPLRSAVPEGIERDCSHRATISSLKVTDRSFRYASLCLLESTCRFISSASPFSSRFTSSSTSQLISVIIPTLVIHHSFTPSSKPTFSPNPSNRRFLLPYWTASR